jgi:DNA-binding XRE family transcriptional regulator
MQPKVAKAARVMAGLTQAQLAARAGVHIGTLVSFETGGRDTRPEIAAKIRGARPFKWLEGVGSSHEHNDHDRQRNIGAHRVCEIGERDWGQTCGSDASRPGAFEAAKSCR